MRRILFLASFVIAFTVVAPGVLAYENSNEGANTSYKEYLKYQEEGVLEEDVTFEYWSEMVSKSKELEQYLEESDDFIEVYSSDDPHLSSFNLTRGDILVSNGTSSAGILGHAGIAISPALILHISGVAGEPPTTIGKATWRNNYTNKTSSSWTKVYRYRNSTTASQAALWARTTYQNSNAEYSIHMDLSRTDKTYCSKIVWQSYYYGPSVRSANGPTWGIRLPYDLNTTIHDVSPCNC